MAPLYQSISTTDSLSTTTSSTAESSKLLDVESGCSSIQRRNNVELNSSSSSSSSSSPSSLLCREAIESQLKKRPVVVLCTMLLLACTVGHTFTVIYYWDNIKSGNPVNANATANAMITTPAVLDEATIQDREMKIRKVNEHKAQNYADDQKKRGLNDPSLESQLYHNKTLSSIMSSQGEYSYDVEGSSNNGHSNYPILGKSKSKKIDDNSSRKTPPPLPPPNGCQATVMLMRHCEKGDIREHCNQLGFERANYISTLFGNDDERWPAPSRLYALNPGSRANKDVQNWREVETIMPLSKKLNLTIDSSYNLKDVKDFAHHIFGLLRSGEICGNIALVSWKHDDLPKLAQRLGCGPKEGCPLTYDDMDFDSVWEIQYTYKKEQYSPYPAAEDKERKHKTWGLYPEWWIYGKVQKENFDPLAYSKKQGVY